MQLLYVDMLNIVHLQLVKILRNNFFCVLLFSASQADGPWVSRATTEYGSNGELFLQCLLWNLSYFGKADIFLLIFWVKNDSNHSVQNMDGHDD